MKTYNHIYDSYNNMKNFFEEINPEPNSGVLVRIHSSIHNKDQMQELTKNIYNLLPEAKIIGCSTTHVICDGKLLPDACLISVSIFENAKIQTTHISCLDSNNELKTGKKLAHEAVRNFLSEKNGFLFIFFPLTYGKIEDFVDTINESDTYVKMLGGVAFLRDENGNSRRDLAYVLEDNYVSMTDVVMALIECDNLNIYGDYVCGVETVGQKAQITSNGCIINKVNNIDGAKWYSDFLGKDALDSNPTLASAFPLVKRGERGVAYYVDYVKADDGKGYFLKSYSELINGSTVSLGYFHPQKIYNQVKELFNNIDTAPVESIFAYDCHARSDFLHNCASWEIANFYTTDISGALLAGEIVHSKGENLYANYTFVTASLSEHDDSHVILRKRELKNISELQEENVQMLNYLLINANMQANETLTEQQSQMKDAMFHNAAVGVDNQLKFLYDSESLNLDKAAIFYLNNERMLKLFAGMPKTYATLNDSYGNIQKHFKSDGLHLYSYEDTSLLIAADDSVNKSDFLETVKKVYVYLNQVSCEEVQFSYTAAVACGNEHSMSHLEATLRYAKAHKLSIVNFEEIGDEAAKAQEEIHMVRVIRDALLNKRVTPFFQEIHNNRGGNKKMYESLMRISDADGRIYFPDQFLPVSKEYDLYESLSELMVETVFELLKEKDIIVTINLNVQDIYDRNMILMIFKYMQNVPHPENFVFEIVESEEITDFDYIKEFSDRIHEYGGKIAIDDFGSGFSNLLHILQIEADYIKIDGAIIRTITQDQHCHDFIKLINGWCEKNNQEVIAEYVENEQIQNMIMEIGVHHSQGYYFSKPHKWED